jgi:translation initiation factor 3 subunit A
LQVNAPLEALNVLQETLLARKSRGAPIASLEPLAIKLIELSVDHKRNRIAREGLHSYKNLVQNTSVASVEKVVRRFLECSESKLKESQEAKAQGKSPIASQEIDDLETPDTYESIFANVLSTFEETAEDIVISTDIQKKDRRERDEVTPRLKFLWDAYRTVLDVLRNNARLELLYQQTVAQAFAFCVRYTRKNEFRRLCDTLRMHLANLPRQANTNYAINLSDPEVLQRFLDTRFLQLQTATDLELWQEGFKSAEDIYQLLVLAGSLIAPATTNNPQVMSGLLPAALFTHKRHGQKMVQMVAQYYDKMTRIFSVSGDGLFLAASWNKYFSWIVNMKGSNPLSDEEQRGLAVNAMLSALAAPIFTEPVDPEASVFRFNRKQRLTVMLGLQAIPDRKSLLLDASSKSVLSRIPAPIRELYEVMEHNFHPLTVAPRLRTLLAHLESTPEYSKFSQPIKSVVIAKILKNLSHLYSTISFDSMIELTSVGGQPMDLFQLEQLIMQGNQKGEFTIKINYLTRSFSFIPIKVATPDLRFLMDLPIFTKQIQMDKRVLYERAFEYMEDEHGAVLSRQEVIESKKVALEQAQLRKAQEEAAEKQRKMQEERETLQKKLAEESKLRELERLRREQEEIRKNEARKIAEALKAKSGVKIADEDLDEMDTAAIFALQADQSKKEKEALDNKMSAVIKRMDYMERAIRKEEIPLLEKAEEEQQVLDKSAFEEARQRAVEEAKERHAVAITIKQRVQRMMPDYVAFRDKLASAHEEKILQEEVESKKKIAIAIQQRREHVRALIKQKIEDEKEEERMRIAKEKLEAERRREAEEREEQRQRELEMQAALKHAQQQRQLQLAREEEEAAEIEVAKIARPSYGFGPREGSKSSGLGFMDRSPSEQQNWVPSGGKQNWTPSGSADPSRRRPDINPPARTNSDRGWQPPGKDAPQKPQVARGMSSFGRFERSESKSDQGVRREFSRPDSQENAPKEEVGNREWRKPSAATDSSAFPPRSAKDSKDLWRRT